MTELARPGLDRHHTQRLLVSIQRATETLEITACICLLASLLCLFAYMAMDSAAEQLALDAAHRGPGPVLEASR